MTEGRDSKLMWAAFGRALGAEPRDHSIIRGASGLDHSVEGISVDERRGRIIIISGELNGRIAAMMQSDIQAKLPDLRVLVARPIAFDIGALARAIAQEMGVTEIDFGNMKRALEKAKAAGREKEDVQGPLGNVLGPIFTAFKNAKLDRLNQILSAVQQITFLDWEDIHHSVARGKPPGENLVISLKNLLTHDTMAVDRNSGVCPIPLYELTGEDWDLLLSGSRVDDIMERLRALGIYQYFFPPADHIALGALDRSLSDRSGVVASALELAPQMGHPLGAPEIVSGSIRLPEILDDLQSRGLIAEGEVGLEITPTGAMARATVKFRPREGFISKLLARLNVNLSASPKDFT
jgi:hypothetical protein